jgi:hypothetical protein
VPEVAAVVAVGFFFVMTFIADVLIRFIYNTIAFFINADDYILLCMKKNSKHLNI